MTQRTMIEPPTIERLFQQLIDGMGYHDAESIPVAEVFKMFKAFYNYEHQRNDELMQLLADYMAVSTKSIIVARKEQ